MLREKIYEIDGHSFSLRDPNDLDLVEDDKVQEFFKAFYAEDKKTISGSVTSDQLSDLFKIILMPEGTLPDGFCFKKIKKGTAAEIIADFFLNSVVSTLSIAGSLRDSILKPGMP